MVTRVLSVAAHDETARWVGHGHRAVHQACLGIRQSAWSDGVNSNVGSPGTCHGGVYGSMNIQLWTPSCAEPVLLSGVLHSEEEEVKPDTSYNVMQILLPKSRRIIWLPLIAARHFNTPTWALAKWNRRLHAMDDSLLATPKQQSAEEEPKPPRKTGRASAIAGRLKAALSQMKSATKASQNASSDSKRKAGQSHQQTAVPQCKTRRS